MRISITARKILLGAALASMPLLPAQTQMQSANPADVDASTLGAPPAYTPRPKDAPPVVDTPAQTAALDQFAAHMREKFEADRKAYNAMVTPSYDFRYGPKNPFDPGNIKVVGKGFIQPGAFPTAEYCGTCHQEAYTQWRQSLHSNAFREPFYRRSVNLLLHDKTRGPSFARHCDSCHNPIGVVSGALTENSKVDRTKFDSDGLTCMVCHSVVSIDGSKNGNADLTIGIPSVMVDEKGNRIPGEVPFDMILRHPERHAQAVMHDFMKTSEFCAACHKANLPDELNDYKFIRAFTAYDEWQLSKFSQRNPLNFYKADFKSCQDCHMQQVKATLPEYGAKNGMFTSHRWLAGNTGAPFYYGFADQLNKTIQFLRTGNYLNVDIFALKRNNEDKLIAPLGRVSYTLKPNDIVEAWVVIQNKGIGHSLIPEIRDLYQAWVEFTVKDENGKEIYHSGFLRPDGTIDPRAHSFTNRPVTDTGDFVDNHRVWLIHSVAYDNTIQAGRSVLVRYQFRLPADVKGAVSVTARVNYRHYRQTYIDQVLGKDHPAYPIVTLASETRVLKIGANHPETPQPGENPDWMRWNNLGIGLLDELQYPRAVEAFHEVVKLRPHYADGYTNIALTEIVWEKYQSARAAIRRALRLEPNDARALYYDGFIARQFGDTPREISDFQRVVAMYPQSRDARRELGITYYHQHENAKATEQFEALQKIDPDDLAAHYDLAILYRRAGKMQQAEDQQDMFIDKKVDPGAPTYSLNYLRAHPEISVESIPWHLHTDLVKPEMAKPERMKPEGAMGHGGK